jgi:hypothetical protein
LYMNSCGKKRSPAWSARCHFGDAGIGHAVHMPLEQGLLVGGRQVAVIRHALVVVVRDEVEDVLLEVGAGAADAVDLVLPDHFRERQAELGGAHRARERDEHLAALGQVRLIRLGGVEQRGGVEMAVVMGNELADGAGTHGGASLRNRRGDAKDLSRLSGNTTHFRRNSRNRRNPAGRLHKPNPLAACICPRIWSLVRDCTSCASCPVCFSSP